MKKRPKIPYRPAADTRPQFEARFLLPQFWGTWARLFLLRPIMYLPRKWVMALGGVLGNHMYRRNKKRRHIAEINLRMCFPELSNSARAKLLREHFRQHARGLLDAALAMWGSRKRIDRIARIDRREWLINMMRKQPVIIIAFHLTTLEMSGAMVAGTHPLVAMMNRTRNPLLTWQMWRGRTHLDKENLQMLMRDQGLRPLVRLIRAGHTCFFSPDEDFGRPRIDAHTVFAPFFGVATSTLTVVGRLAKMTGAVVLPSATRLDPKTGCYTMTVDAPLKNFPSNAPQADAAAVNRAMETLIRAAPAEYMWTFRRFKSRPDGGANPYKQNPPQ